MAVPGYLVGTLQWDPMTFIDFEPLSILAPIGSAIIVGTLVIALIRQLVLRRRRSTETTLEGTR